MQNLFSEFKPSTAADWKNQVLKDLKGEPLENLIWHNENGIEVKPFYTSEDLKQAYEPAFTHADWEICVKGKSNDAKEINAQFLMQLNAGATSISLNCSGLDLDVALNDIQLNYIHSTFLLNEANANSLKTYLEKKYPGKDLPFSLFPESLSSSKDLENWMKVMDVFKDFKNCKSASADALDFHNQNCFAYYELAIILSQLTEYLEALSSKKEIPSSAFVVKTGVNSDYFIQIAKLRAIRRLWAVLKADYKIQHDLYVIVETGLTNKSISDSYTNLLRTTVEAMAAASGGCNELIVTEFDILFPTNKVLGERMAINQQLILKEESYFDKMADTACGSYYIESMTDALAQKALETFQSFEAEGGFFNCLKNGKFNKDISIQAAQLEEKVKTQKQILIGVNKFKNEKENIRLSKEQREALQQMNIQNPGLNFELEHYFNLKNA
jgi:methylmalonyl-CoA mutase